MRDRAGLLLNRWPRLHGLADGLMSGGAQLAGVSGHVSAIGLTLAIWVTQAGIAYLAVIAVDPGSSFWPAMTAGAAANLAFALPITGIAGLGPAQAAWATALNLAGTPWDTAIASALAGYAVVLTGALVLGGFALATSARSGNARELSDRDTASIDTAGHPTSASSWVAGRGSGPVPIPRERKLR